MAFLLAVLIGVYYVRLWPRVNNKDLAVHVHAAAVLAAGGDIYADVEPWIAALENGTFMQDPDLRWPFIYPPSVAILLLPLAALPYAPMALGWTVASILMLVAAGWLCLEAQGPVEPLDVALLGVALYAFYPAVVAVRLGQLEILQFLLLAGTFWGLKRGHDDLAGVLLGLATAIKFFPGALIALLIWKRLWRPAAVAIATACTLLFGSFAVIGLDQVARYLGFTSVYTRGPFGAFPLNQSLHGFFQRNLTVNLFTPPLKGWHLPWLAEGLTLGFSAILVGAWAWLTWGGLAAEGGPGKSVRFDLEFGGSIALMLLVMPHSQVYGFVYLLLPTLVLAYQLRRFGPHWAWPPAVVAYALFGRHYWITGPGITRLAAGHVMLGTLLLLGLIGVLLYRSGAPGRVGGEAKG